MVVVVLAIAGVCLKRKMSTTTNSDDVDAKKTQEALDVSDH